MGLLNLARQGRNGDTRIAHLTPGEVVIPREVAQLRPDLVAHVGQQIKQMGGDPRRIVAGQGRINPNTGMEEFATEDEVKAAYASIGRTADAEGMDYWKSQDNLSAFAGTAQNVMANENIASNVNNLYQTNFSRDAENSGREYWENEAKAGKYKSVDELNKAIQTAAHGDGLAAFKDTKDTYQSAWDGSIDPNTDAYHYNVTKSVWEKNKKAQPEAIVAGGYTPNFNSSVDANTETIEGRITNLLDANNPVIQQAGNRAMAQFAQRGLLNSSMAIEAAQEAMTSKAIEIAGPDAEKYFQNRRQNVDWNNNFARDAQNFQYDLAKVDKTADANTKVYESQATIQQKNALQTNYLSAMQNAEAQMRNYINTIQSSDMPSEAKTAQIVEAQNMMNGTISMLKAAYQKMPQWADEWATLPATLA